MSRITKIIFIILFGVGTGFAQTQQEEPNMSKMTLDEQFKYFRNNSENYGEYKVMKATKLNSFWSVVQDSLKTKNSSIVARDSEIAQLASTIDGLQNELEQTKEALTSSQEESAGIPVFGILINKGSFVIFFYIFSAVLLVAIGVLAFLFSTSNTVTRQTSKDNDELHAQMKELRQKFMDREIVLKRELQTERNLVEELKNKVIV